MEKLYHLYIYGKIVSLIYIYIWKNCITYIYMEKLYHVDSTYIYGKIVSCRYSTYIYGYIQYFIQGFLK